MKRYTAQEKRGILTEVFTTGIEAIQNKLDSLERLEKKLDIEDKLIACGIVEADTSISELVAGDELGGVSLILLLDTGEAIEIDKEGNHTRGVA